MDLDKLAGTQALQEADQAGPDELLLSGLAWGYCRTGAPRSTLQNDNLRSLLSAGSTTMKTAVEVGGWDPSIHELPRRGVLGNSASD